MFIYQYLHFKNFVDKVLEKCTGTSYPAINSSDLGKIIINLPTLSEQQKIASFFMAIDSKLDLLRKKRDLMEKYKKGVMQKIFPSTGSGTSQEIRFRDENENDYPDWEEKKLGEVGKFFSGGTPTSTVKEFYSGEINFIRSGEINSHTTDLLITEEGLNNSSAKIVEVGDLLYALYGATSGEVAISKIKGAINQAVLCLRTQQNKIFIYHYLKYSKNNIVSKYLQGGQGNLSAEIIKSLIVPVPSLPEQEKIANFLSSIDTKIENLVFEIERFEKWKKGLLGMMFC